MTVEVETHSVALSVLRSDPPVDDLGARLERAQQGDGPTVSLRMWRARDGLAARLRLGTPPQQALADWGCQTAWDLLALEARAVTALAMAEMPEEEGLVALSYLFADALLNSDPKWRAQAVAWDLYFAKTTDCAGSETDFTSNLCIGAIDQAHAELTGLAETATHAYLEAVLARAGMQAQGDAAERAADLAHSREAVLAGALLDLANPGRGDGA